MRSSRLTNPSRAANGRSVSDLPYKANCGVWGSYICVLICVCGLMGQFYVALYPVGGPNLDPELFFQLYLAGPLLIFLYLIWKGYSWFKVPSHRRMWVDLSQVDIYTGMREGHRAMMDGHGVVEEDELSDDDLKKGGVKNQVIRILRNVF
jgi:amino acid transporter